MSSEAYSRRYSTSYCLGDIEFALRGQLSTCYNNKKVMLNNKKVKHE